MGGVGPWRAADLAARKCDVWPGGEPGPEAVLFRLFRFLLAELSKTLFCFDPDYRAGPRGFPLVDGPPFFCQLLAALLLPEPCFLRPLARRLEELFVQRAVQPAENARADESDRRAVFTGERVCGYPKGARVSRQGVGSIVAVWDFGRSGADYSGLRDATSAGAFMWIFLLVAV